MEITVKTIRHFAPKNIENARKKWEILNVCEELSSYVGDNMQSGVCTIPPEMLETLCKKHNITANTFLQYIYHYTDYYYESNDCFTINERDIYAENFSDFTESQHYTGIHGFYEKFGNGYQYIIADVKKKYVFFILGIAFCYDRGDKVKEFSVESFNFNYGFTENPITLFKDTLFDNIEYKWYGNFQEIARDKIYDNCIDHDIYTNMCYDSMDTITDDLIYEAQQEANVYFIFSKYMRKENHKYCFSSDNLEDFILDMLNE